MKKSKVKLGVSYSIFSGEELLEASIKSIRDQVDYINVVYQKQSWFGDSASQNIEEILTTLKNKKLIDNIIEYDFNDFGNTDKLSKYVLDKKNKGLQDLLKQNCTHGMFMDVDEFYVAEDFSKAKQFIFDNKITHSACAIYDYKFSPKYRQKDVNKYSVPFIFKLKRWVKMSAEHKMPCHVDPLRSLKFNRKRDIFYYINTVTMHHMTGIRIDFKKKLKASVTNATQEGKDFVQNYENQHLFLKSLPEEEFLKKGYILVDDIFNIEGVI